MRHRIKKIPSLISHHKTKHLLHSDKRTYFYKPKLGNNKWLSSFSKHTFSWVASVEPVVTGLRRSSSLVSSGSPKKKVFAKLRQRFSYSIVKTIPLVLSAFALLLVLGGLVCPGVSVRESAFAEDGIEPHDGNPAISLSLADVANHGNMTIIDGNKNIQQQIGDNDNNLGYIAVDFNVTASNIDKYDIYVQSSSDKLVGEAKGEKISSINTDTTYENMKKATGWGYAVAKGEKVNAETLTYKPIQTSANTSVSSGSATNTSITQPYTLAFAANLAGATSDHYESNITLSVAAGATQVATLYSVSYNTNGSTGGTTPTTQMAESDSNTYSFTVPTGDQYQLMKGNYGLAGWSEDPSATTPEYKTGSTITLTAISPIKTLYAVWTPALGAISSMQDMTSSICNATLIGASKRLTDTRDSNTYWVTKLSDGNCWMTQNLDLDLSTNRTLTEADTDFVDSTTKSWTPTENTMTSAPTSNTWPTTNNIVKSYDPGFKYCNNGNCNATTSNNNGHDAQGNYYTFMTATAGTAPANIGESTGSICPKGWRLPSTTNSKEPTFNALIIAYGVGDNLTGSDILNQAPLYFTYSGLIGRNSTLANVGDDGSYWSSTASSANNAYRLWLSSNNASPSNTGGNRYYGAAVRCVAR